MKLRKPCKHGRYEEHQWRQASDWPRVADSTLLSCLGGEFLENEETGLTADMIEKALATPDRKWSRGTIMDAAAAYGRILADG